MEKKNLIIGEFKGLDTSNPSTKSNPAVFSDARNFRIYYGELIKRNGLVKVDTLPLRVVSLANFGKFSGVFTLLAFTRERVYACKSSGGTLAFTDITDTIFSGSDRDFFSSCSYLDKFIFTNGVDAIRQWDGAAATVSDAGIPYLAKVILPYAERIVLYNTTESGNACPQRIRWSAIGTINDFSGETSSFADLVTVLGNDQIVAAEPFGNAVVIYGKTNMVYQSYTGSSPAFSFETITKLKGAVSPNAILVFPGLHIFMSTDGINSYEGGTKVSNAIGNAVNKEILATINRNALDMVYAEYKDDTHECVFHIPLGSTTYCEAAYVLNMDNGTWMRYYYGSDTNGYNTCCCRYRSLTPLTIGELSGTIGDLDFKIGAAFTGVAYPFSAYGTDKGIVYRDFENCYTDGNTPLNIDAYVETVDFVNQADLTKYLHFTDFFIEGQGGRVDVYYSTDEGNVFTLLGTLTFGATWETKVIDVWPNITAKKVRLMISCTEVDRPHIRRIQAFYEEGSEVL